MNESIEQLAEKINIVQVLNQCGGDDGYISPKEREAWETFHGHGISVVEWIGKQITQAINQAREADRRKIEELEQWQREWMAEWDRCQEGNDILFVSPMAQREFWESMANDEGAEPPRDKKQEQINQLESKVLELTEAAKAAKLRFELADKHHGFDSLELRAQLSKALSTTPATEIREKIRAEVVEEFIEAAWKAFDEEFGWMNEHPLQELHKESLVDSFGDILNNAQSLKKGGTL